MSQGGQAARSYLPSTRRDAQRISLLPYVLTSHVALPHLSGKRRLNMDRNSVRNDNSRDFGIKLLVGETGGWREYIVGRSGLVFKDIWVPEAGSSPTVCCRIHSELPSPSPSPLPYIGYSLPGSALDTSDTVNIPTEDSCCTRSAPTRKIWLLMSMIHDPSSSALPSQIVLTDPPPPRILKDPLPASTSPTPGQFALVSLLVINLTSYALDLTHSVVMSFPSEAAPLLAHGNGNGSHANGPVEPAVERSPFIAPSVRPNAPKRPSVRYISFTKPQDDHPHAEQHSDNNGAVIRDMIIGFADGLTVPFALTAGLSSLGSTKLVVIGGLAELFSGMISMGLGAYLAAATERQQWEAEYARECWEVDHCPEREREEIYEVLEKYGISRDGARGVVEELCVHTPKGKKRWVQFMMDFELQLPEPHTAAAWKSALTSKEPLRAQISSFSSSCWA